MTTKFLVTTDEHDNVEMDWNAIEYCIRNCNPNGLGMCILAHRGNETCFIQTCWEGNEEDFEWRLEVRLPHLAFGTNHYGIMSGANSGQETITDLDLIVEAFKDFYHSRPFAKNIQWNAFTTD